MPKKVSKEALVLNSIDHSSYNWPVYYNEIICLCWFGIPVGFCKPLWVLKDQQKMHMVIAEGDPGMQTVMQSTRSYNRCLHARGILFLLR